MNHLNCPNPSRRAEDTPALRFKLYIAGEAPNSLQARNNLEKFCRQFLPQSPEIEIIDIFKFPMQALADGVVVTPTLVKISPQPIHKITGTLSDPSQLMAELHLQPKSL